MYGVIVKQTGEDYEKGVLTYHLLSINTERKRVSFRKFIERGFK